MPTYTFPSDEITEYSQTPGLCNVTGVVGKDLVIDVLFENTDLTGYTFSASVVIEPAPLEKTYAMTVTEIDLANGLISILLTDTDTAAIGPVSNKSWVLSWTTLAGLKFSVIAGRFQLNRL